MVKAVFRNCRGLIPQTIQDELDRFNAHLDAVCGLASATRTSRRMWVRKFLVDRFGSAPIEIDRIQPADIVEFMVRPTNHYSPGTAGVLGKRLAQLPALPRGEMRRSSRETGGRSADGSALAPGDGARTSHI